MFWLKLPQRPFCLAGACWSSLRVESQRGQPGACGGGEEVVVVAGLRSSVAGSVGMPAEGRRARGGSRGPSLSRSGASLGHLWLSSGGLGKLWRLWPFLPPDVEREHAELLLCLRRRLLPHEGDAGDAAQLRQLLAVLAGKVSVAPAPSELTCIAVADHMDMVCEPLGPALPALLPVELGEEEVGWEDLPNRGSLRCCG